MTQYTTILPIKEETLLDTIKLTLVTASIFIIVSITGCYGDKTTNSANMPNPDAIASVALDTMKLSSPTAVTGKSLTKAQVFNSWGCTGNNISPALMWSDIPEGTKSFAVTMYDPDAPSGSGWWHWVMIDIPSTLTSLPADAGNKDNKNIPSGAVHVMNDFGYKGFDGACPPAGAMPHNYTITVYALNVEKLDIPADASPALAGYNIHQHVIGEGKIIAPTKMR